MNMFREDLYCSSTLNGRDCGNRVYRHGKCYQHRVSKCTVTTNKGRICKSGVFAYGRCWMHQTKENKQEIKRMNDIQDKKDAEMDYLTNKIDAMDLDVPEKRVIFDLSENKTIVVSRYIKDLKKYKNGKYIYEKKQKQRS